MAPIVRMFDKLEDHVRGWLSHRPILYAFIGGIGVVLFWRGVWHTADYLTALMNASSLGGSNLDLAGMVWWDGPLSLVIACVLLLMVGAFVSSFIGNEIILSGLRGEKKLSERTARDLRVEVGAIADIRGDVADILKKLDERLQESDK